MMSSIPEQTWKADILVVDDQPENLHLLSSLLRQVGYNVRQSLNAEMALTSVGAKLPDLILLDVRIPGMSGYELCRHLKSSENTSKIPIIFLSALNDIDSIMEGFQVGGVDYITKPFHNSEVLIRVNTQLRLYQLQKQLELQNQSLQEQIRLSQIYLHDRQVAEATSKLLEKAIAATQNGVVITDPNQPDNPIIYVNFGFERLTGYPAHEILGSNCRFLQGNERDQPALDDIRQAIAEAEECRVILKNYRRDGTMFWNELFISPVRNEQGELTNFIGIQTDVTERKKSEEALERSRIALKKTNQELQRLALYDDLTQVANRRRFNEYLAYNWHRCSREQEPIALILCDVDYFKPYNDTFGHQAGDDCLHKIARAISGAIQRSVDLVARYGGEEFAIILPNTPINGAVKVAERIRKEVENLRVPHPGSQSSDYVTVSLGVACKIPHSELSVDSLIAQADEALYQAKNQGRNCTVIAESPSCELLKIDDSNPICFPHTAKSTPLL
ncbi:diguanylate cyclase [Arthrospira platensis NCB002]|uniref:diguanylate cyclase domain-containing protein n=1 Tax=Limnospira platensis TaxID=118562 RepID=UPI0002F52573|nr:diguanylate cyclase [Arthrospira platensis NCB002]BDT11383.1 two-component response regulator [Arthrospira platensis NIES-39]